MGCVPSALPLPLCTPSSPLPGGCDAPAPLMWRRLRSSCGTWNGNKRIQTQVRLRRDRDDKCIQSQVRRGLCGALKLEGGEGY